MRCLFLLSLAALAFAQTPGSVAVRENYSKFEYRIPMRDGVKLFTSLYVPKDVFSEGKRSRSRCRMWRTRSGKGIFVVSVDGQESAELYGYSESSVRGFCEGDGAGVYRRRGGVADFGAGGGVKNARRLAPVPLPDGRGSGSTRNRHA